MSLSLIASILSLMCAFVFFYLWYKASSKLQAAERNLRSYQTTFLTKQGWSQGSGTYHLVSIDGGKHWWNVTGSDITGPADFVLLSHLQGMDALIAHAQKHGPIGSRPITSEDIRALEGAGFTVTR